MILFKIIQQFLTPSVFIPLIAFIGFLLLRAKKKIGTTIIIINIVLYYFLSISPISDLIIAPLENKYNQIEDSQVFMANKAVILLGGPESDVLRGTEATRLSILNPDLQIIITGQNFLNKEKTEALRLKNHLIEQGVKAENIILEKESRTTKESAKNIKKMVKTEKFFLITSGYHMPRSMFLFKKEGTNPLPAPTDFKAYKSFSKNKWGLRYSNYNLLDFFPCSQNLKNVDLAFHEYFGILYSQLID